MSFSAFLGWLFGRSSEDPTRDDFIEFDWSGKARFDVAGYLASEKGAEALARFADANCKASKNLDAVA